MEVSVVFTGAPDGDDGPFYLGRSAELLALARRLRSRGALAELIETGTFSGTDALARELARLPADPVVDRMRELVGVGDPEERPWSWTNKGPLMTRPSRRQPLMDMAASHHADPGFPGWHLLGTFPQGDPDGVASWLLHHGGRAVLLEIPPGLRVDDVQDGLAALGRPGLILATASHLHLDHFDPAAWNALKAEFPDTTFERPDRRPTAPPSEAWSDLAGEPLCFIRAPKHSAHDTVTVFRGVAMTGDIELGTLRSVNASVAAAVKSDSMRWLAGFPDRHAYRVHSIMSAHLNDVRRDLDGPGLAALFDPTTFASAEDSAPTPPSRSAKRPPPGRGGG